MLFMMFIVCSPRVTWFSSCSSRVHSFWHGFHHCSSCVMVFWHGFHHVSSCAHCFFTCMAFIILLHVLAVFQHKMSHVYTFVLKNISTTQAGNSLQIYQNLEHIPLLGISLFFRLLSKGPATFPHSNNCLDSERNCLSCARWCKDTPYKNCKNTPQKAPFGWEWLPACMHFFGPTCHLRWKQGSQQVKTVGYTRVNFKPSIQK